MGPSQAQPKTAPVPHSQIGEPLFAPISTLRYRCLCGQRPTTNTLANYKPYFLILGPVRAVHRGQGPHDTAARLGSGWEAGLRRAWGSQGSNFGRLQGVSLLLLSAVHARLGSLLHTPGSGPCASDQPGRRHRFEDAVARVAGLDHPPGPRRACLARKKKHLMRGGTNGPWPRLLWLQYQHHRHHYSYCLLRCPGPHGRATPRLPGCGLMMHPFSFSSFPPFHSPRPPPYHSNHF